MIAPLDSVTVLSKCATSIGGPPHNSCRVITPCGGWSPYQGAPSRRVAHHIPWGVWATRRGSYLDIGQLLPPHDAIAPLKFLLNRSGSVHLNIIPKKLFMQYSTSLFIMRCCCHKNWNHNIGNVIKFLITNVGVH